MTYVERPFESTKTAAYRVIFDVQEVNVAVASAECGLETATSPLPLSPKGGEGDEQEGEELIFLFGFGFWRVFTGEIAHDGDTGIAGGAYQMQNAKFRVQRFLHGAIV